MNALQKYELEEIDGLDLQDEQIKERFKIENKEQLNWALRMLSALDNEKNEIDELTAKEIERITAWRGKEVEGINHTKGFFEGLIMEYAFYCRKENPEFKSVKTPYGSIGYKKQQPKWLYDDQKLIEHLESASSLDLIRIKKEPVKTEIKKRFKIMEDGRVVDEDGIIVDGITVEFLEEKLDIKVGA